MVIIKSTKEWLKLIDGAAVSYMLSDWNVFWTDRNGDQQLVVIGKSNVVKEAHFFNDVSSIRISDKSYNEIKNKLSGAIAEEIRLKRGEG